jgi:RHS repeat-associated protein
LAANVLLREKPHQGVPSRNLVLRQGIDERNSTAAIGLRAGLLLNRVQSRYTGKERDTESGLDYFGARYYASSKGRWMSPDWADKPEAVPYSDLDDPQSLNLYGYVRNNPLNKADADGHDETDVLKIAGGVELIAPELTPAIVGITGGILLGQTIWNNRGAIGDAIVDAAGRGTMMGAVRRHEQAGSIKCDK